MKKNTCNHTDHENWSRRSFIKALGFTGAGAMTLANTGITFAQQSKLNAAIEAVENDKILIIIQLFGGNDGLNMIVPINQYDEYANARPTIKVAQNDLLNLSDEYGMNNQMQSLENLWQEDKMKIIHSVGYEDHVKSHFKGADIFNSAQIEEQDSGWLGRHFEEIYPDYAITPPASPTAIQIGSSKNISFNATNDTNYSYAVANISRLESVANTGLSYSLDGLPDCTYGDQLRFVRGAVNNTYNYADSIHKAYENSTDYTVDGGYPTNNDFADSLAVIARLIKGNLGTKVYMFTIRGFDTHSNQSAGHSQLLKDLADAISYFQKDMTAAGWEDKILSMTVSEFGRRIFENGSNGTDHGTSYPLMLFGSGLNGSGFVGNHASLKTEDLVSGDLQHHTDFRNIYATILKEWLCVDSSVVDNVILQGQFDTIDLGLSCSSLSNEDIPNSINSFTAKISIQNQRTHILLTNNSAQHIVIKLYSVSGREIGNIKNDFFTEGTYSFDVKASIKKDIPTGPYIFRAVSNNNVISKVIPIS